MIKFVHIQEGINQIVYLLIYSINKKLFRFWVWGICVHLICEQMTLLIYYKLTLFVVDMRFTIYPSHTKVYILSVRLNICG